MMISIHCQRSTLSLPSRMDELDAIFSRSIDVPEPSGLCLDYSGNYLWTVSDQTGNKWKLKLSGEIIKEIPFCGQNLEGISMATDGNRLYVVEELRREIICTDIVRIELSRHSIPIRIDQKENQCYPTRAATIFLANILMRKITARRTL